MRFAETCLGDASKAVLSSGEATDWIIQRMKEGFDLEDAALAHLFERARTDHAIAGEFLGYFLADLLRLGSLRVPRGFRNLMDSGDLVQSMLGDFWKGISEVQFETRAQFKSYLSKRIRWKALDKDRWYKARTRREDLRESLADEPVQRSKVARSPSSQAAHNEENEDLMLAIYRLPDRDREMLLLQLKGETVSAIGQRFGLSAEAAKKALQRAKRRAMEQLGHPGKSEVKFDDA